MGEYLFAISQLFNLKQSQVVDVQTTEKILCIICRSGSLTAVECEQIMKETNSNTRLEKLFQILALQDEVHNADFLKCLRTIGLNKAISMSEDLLPNNDKEISKQLAACFSRIPKVDRLGKFPCHRSTFKFVRREEPLLYDAVEQLTKAPPPTAPSSNNILWLKGGAGHGTTSLVTKLVYDCDFLLKCQVSQVIWLDMQQLAPLSTLNDGQGFKDALVTVTVVNEMARLLLGPESVFYDEMDHDGPSSVLLAHALIVKMNESIARHITAMPGHIVLLVVDSVTSQASLEDVISRLHPAFRCLAISNCKIESSGLKPAEITNSNQKQLVVSAISDEEIANVLSNNLPRKNAERLAVACNGSPLIARLIQSQITIDSSANFDSILAESQTAANIDLPCLRGGNIKDTMTVQLLDGILEGNLFWRSFLLFDPGEAVDVDDLILIWKCSQSKAVEHCRDFCKKGLIRPLIDPHSSTGNESKFFCVHSLVYDATLRLAASRQKLAVSQVKSLSELRFAIIHHAFIAENGNIESTFHEAVRLGRRKLIGKIISIVESVDYLWKFSECQLIIINLADYFYQNANGFLLEEKNPEKSPFAFERVWLQLFCRFLATLAKDERRIVSIAKSLAVMYSRSVVAAAFIQQVFVYAAAFNGIELLTLLLESSALKNNADSFVHAQESRFRRTALIVAAMHGDKMSTRLLVEAGADVTVRDAIGKTALTAALEHGQVEVAKMLFDITLAKVRQLRHEKLTTLPENVQQCDGTLIPMLPSYHLSPLISAALSGQENVTKFVLKRGGYHINAVDDRQRTALMGAVWSNNIGVVKMILDAGANINVVDEYGRGALCRAIEHGNVDLVRLLLERGADPNRRDKDGRSALLTAVEVRNYHFDVIALLVEFNANLKTANQHGQTALLLAAKNGRHRALQLFIEHCPGVVNLKDAHGVSALSAAAERGHCQSLKILIDKGAVVDARDSNGQTPLMKAAEAGQFEACQMLLTRGADVNMGDYRKLTALHLAAEHGETQVVNLLLEKFSADATLVDKRGSTALMLAVESGYIDIVNAFLKHKNLNLLNCVDANKQSALMISSHKGDVLLTNKLLSIVDTKPAVNKANNEGLTALMLAVKNGHIAVVQLLVENGVDINACSNSGTTALLFSVCYGHAATAQMLIDHGADVDVQDDRGSTALMIAAKHGFVTIVNMLLQRGADVTRHDIHGRTALMRAAEQGHTAIVEILIAYGKAKSTDESDFLLLDATNKHGRTALVKAAENGHVSVIRLLLDNGAVDGVASALLTAASNGYMECVQVLFDSGREADIMQATGTDALIEAIRSEQDVVVKFLLDRGIPADAKDDEGNSALIVAVSEGNIGLVRTIIKHGANINMPGHHGTTPLLAAAKEGNADVVGLLIAQGAEIDAKDEHNTTALTVAARYRNGKIAKILLDAGADANAENEWGETALITAVRTADAVLVRNLLERDCDINATDKHGYSALLIAIWKCDLTITRLLLNAGADIHAKDSDGYNGLMIAVRNKQHDIARALIDLGIDINVQNVHGYTALSIAVLRRDSSFVELLRSAGADPLIKDTNGKSAVDVATRMGRNDLIDLLQTPQSV